MAEKKSKKKAEEKEIGYVKPRNITQEMKDSYIDYAMSVIISRALPDARDGLKPVQRRILYAMYEMGLKSSGGFRKSAAVTGRTMGRYHPHGDAPIYDALARMAQDFSFRYTLVHGQGNFGCFTGDTEVKLTDGRNLSFKELVEEAKQGEENYTFSFNSEKEKIEITKIQNPRVTRKNEKIMKVTLDNGEEIKCTLDHKFMLRDGNYKEAENLEKGDSLMPLYTKKCEEETKADLKGYKMVKQPVRGNWDFIHHLADQWNLEHEIYDRSTGRIRHHEDFDKFNNNPDNIKRIPWRDHWNYHKKVASEKHNDPEYRERLAKGRKEYWSREENRKEQAERMRKRNRENWEKPEYREKMIKAIKEKWEDPKYREKMKKMASRNLKERWQDENFQELMSEIKSKELKERWQDKEYRKKMTEHMREISERIWSDPGHRKKMSELMKEKAQNPEWKERQSKIAEELWKNPEYRNKYPEDHFKKMAEKLWEDPEFRKKQKKKAEKQWEDPEFQRKFIEGVKKSNRQRLDENPNYMDKLAEKAANTLKKKWQKKSYKNKVIRSKILGHVNQILEKHSEATPELYEKERVNNGVPKFKNALDYFDNFSEIVEEAKRHNHKVVSTEILDKREDVYDITTEPSHNFALGAGIFVHNSLDGDPPAAQRYTEAKLSKLGEEMLRDIEKDTVDFRDNYDGTHQEPKVLPSPVPQLLLNGCLGIAVGVATKIPPHNLSEVIDASIHLLEHPKADTEDLFKFIQGPDFPTGGVIYNQEKMISAYSQGKGPIVIRGSAEIKKEKGKSKIIINELPYQVQKSSLVKKIANLVKDDKIKGIKDLRDESSKEGVRIVVLLKQGSFPKQILSQLYKFTRLQKTFHLNAVALVDGIQPQVLSLPEILKHFLEHRKDIILRRCKYELRKAEDRAHILEGLDIALANIDDVIEIIKKSKHKTEARKNLRKEYDLSVKQADAILAMRLSRLSKLEREKIQEELKEKKKRIKELKKIIGSSKEIKKIVKKEMKEMKKKYGDERRTRIIDEEVGEISKKDLIPKKETLVTLTKGGYIKRVNPGSYKIQNRGGKGIIGMKIGEDDWVQHFLLANTLDSLLFFTDSGKVFKIPAYEIPKGGRTSKGRGVSNFLDISTEEKVLSIIPMKSESEEKYLIMATENGIIKKTAIDDFKNIRQTGIKAIKLKKGDLLKKVDKTSGKDDVMIVTKKGKAIRFDEDEVRSTGRVTSGVKAIDLAKGDELVGMSVIKKGEKKGKKLLIITTNGFGKRTELKKYRAQSRAGKGVKTAQLNKKTGEIMASKIVDGKKDLIVMSKKGQVIRTKVDSVSVQGRTTQGVRIMKLKKGDQVASIAVI